MSNRTCLSIVLAAGEGTRMKSALPKVLHKIAGLPMVAHVARAAAEAGAGDIALVTGSRGEETLKAVAPYARAERFEQTERQGTAHAALAAKAAIARRYDDVLVAFGDTPLVRAQDLAAARARLAEGAVVAVMGFRTDRPTGYGRLIEQGGRLVAIREERDCSEAERRIGLCNGGVMAIDGRHALALLEKVGNDNAKREYYLTDIVEIANAEGLKVVATEAPADTVLGINNRVELAEAEAIWQAARRREAMLAGATLVAPETVHFSFDTVLGTDVTVEPNVVFAPGVTVGDGAVVHAFSHLEGATVGPGASVGPFARLRPGAHLEEKAKVGNFVEVKQALIGAGAKVNHLTYIGDASVGAETNIGAGTITCNYDGFNKHRTEIGAGAFIGSNSALVAPVKIGAGAYIASGSVITKDVPDDALAFGRAHQAIKEGRARTIRERHAATKKARG